MFFNMGRKVAVLMAAMPATNSVDSVFVVNPIFDDNGSAKIQVGAWLHDYRRRNVKSLFGGRPLWEHPMFMQILRLKRVPGTYGPFVSFANIAPAYGLAYDANGSYNMTGYSMGYQVEKSKLGALHTASSGLAEELLPGNV